ncbi:MAG: DegT/DnrJ/EryC1/StrS family aminotransferase [Acidimicrobiales bacterium]
MAVPLIDVRAHRARIGNDIDQAITRVVQGGQWIMGPEVAELEAALARWIGAGVHALGCSNGTDALVLGLQALGLQPGDVVICPSFTFVATAEAVANLGGEPVFADVHEHTHNIDVASVQAALERARGRGRRVVGVIAVDLFGHPADYPALRALTEREGLWLLADAAQSFGAATPDGNVGALADVTTTSFFPAKPLGCYGDGGAVFTADEALLHAMRSLRVHGTGSDKYDNVRIGHNARLDTIQAAVLLPKLAILGDELDARQQVADAYAAAPRGPGHHPTLAAGNRWPGRSTPSTPTAATSCSRLTAEGIGNAVYYPILLHRQQAYTRFRATASTCRCRSGWPSVLSLPEVTPTSPTSSSTRSPPRCATLAAVAA